MTLMELLKAKGIDDNIIQAIQEEMKANKIFTASEENLDVRYGKLKTEHEGVTKQLGEATSLIEELKKSNKGNEGLQQKITDYEGQMAKLQAENEQIRLDSAIKIELLSSKALDVDYLTFKLKEKGELALDENGKVKGWDDKLAALKTQFPTQFESAGARKYEEHRLPDVEPTDKVITKEEFNKMGYNSRVAFKQSNPEQYSQMMKG